MMVSVLMPVFNGAPWVADAVASVQRQREIDLELLIHDDGSQDETGTVVEALAAQDSRISLSKGANRGPALSRNRLLAQARGDFIAFLDHDDLWPDGRLARQLGRLSDVPDAPGVLGETLIFEALADDGTPVRARRVRAGLLQAGLFRRSALAGVGGFDVALLVADDFDYLLRVIEEAGPLEIDNQVAVWYRVHPGQWTRDLEHTGQGTARALARSLRRRRATGAASALPWRIAG
jgi:glycosyltransferase involved in cell wall biosynthesis